MPSARKLAHEAAQGRWEGIGLQEWTVRSCTSCCMAVIALTWLSCHRWQLSALFGRSQQRICFQKPMAVLLRLRELILRAVLPFYVVGLGGSVTRFSTTND
jgi:hypothetical protein